MYQPQFRGAAKRVQTQAVQFGGLNYTQATQDGELAQAVGVSERMWPCLTTRAGRREVRALERGTDLYAWGKLVAVDGADLLYDGEAVGRVKPGKKQFAVVGSKLCIFPDKKYLDMNTKEMGDLQATVNSSGAVEAAVAFTGTSLELQGKNTVLSRYYYELEGDGIDITVYTKFKVFKLEDIAWNQRSGWTVGAYVEKTARELTAGDCIMLPLSESGIRGDRDPDENFNNTSYAKEWDQWGDFVRVSAKPEWRGGYPSSWFKIPLERHNAAGIYLGLENTFHQGDRLTISGCVDLEGNNREKIQVEKVEGLVITFALNETNQFTPGLEYTGVVTICREVPDLDFICESGGRLWGVCNADGQIYASYFQDPANFYAYIDADGATAPCSWTIPVGTDGDFTACVAYGSNVLCFKENALHKILGTHAGNYELFSYQIAGVMAGCEKSLQIINEVLYYKGRDGVYAYAGGTPRRVSGKLGLVEYGRAVAGQDGRSYIISMERLDTGAWETLRYGIETGLWMAEDDRETTAFATLDGTLYAMIGGTIYRQEGEDDGGEAIEWSATFVPFMEGIHRKKGLSRLLLYLELDPGAWVEVDVAQDTGPFKTIWAARANGPRAMSAPIRPGRCNTFQVRLRGKGRFVLRSMTREFSVGGDKR